MTVDEIYYGSYLKYIRSSLKVVYCTGANEFLNPEENGVISIVYFSLHKKWKNLKKLLKKSLMKNFIFCAVFLFEILQL